MEEVEQAIQRLKGVYHTLYQIRAILDLVADSLNGNVTADIIENVTEQIEGQRTELTYIKRFLEVIDIENQREQDNT